MTKVPRKRQSRKSQTPDPGEAEARRFFKDAVEKMGLQERRGLRVMLVGLRIGHEFTMKHLATTAEVMRDYDQLPTTYRAMALPMAVTATNAPAVQ